MFFSFTMISFSNDTNNGINSNEYVKNELQPQPGFNMEELNSLHDGNMVTIASELPDPSTMGLGAVTVSLVRSGDTEEVQVYLVYSGSFLSNAIRCSSLVVSDTSFFNPVIYKEWEDVSRYYTAGNLAYAYIGRADIPASEDKAKVKTSGLQVYNMEKSSWNSYTNVGGSWSIN